MHVVCANIFGAIVLKPRFKIDAVIMIIVLLPENLRTCFEPSV